MFKCVSASVYGVAVGGEGVCVQVYVCSFLCVCEGPRPCGYGVIVFTIYYCNIVLSILVPFGALVFISFYVALLHSAVNGVISCLTEGYFMA